MWRDYSCRRRRAGAETHRVSGRAHQRRSSDASTGQHQKYGMSLNLVTRNGAAVSAVEHFTKLTDERGGTEGLVEQGRASELAQCGVTGKSRHEENAHARDFLPHAP